MSQKSFFNILINYVKTSVKKYIFEIPYNTILQYNTIFSASLAFVSPEFFLELSFMLEQFWSDNV